MNIYPAYVHFGEDGSASGFFPDVVGCYFAIEPDGDLFSEAISALDFHFESLAEKGDDIPQPCNVFEHLRNDSDGIYQDGQWFNVSIDTSKYDGKVERINVTLPHRLIYQIDLVVKSNAEYKSRSYFLANAARKELQKAKA
ncbi:type II toxin-antitoxin system HicB family antitoxin [Thorsellia anophelis]|uniref:Predicted nuclease of the RNAse H fold, HicB family n=1 Tax=Thorsellia anophelis DSM 18579 TaxID=1123402 RepID=A0A1I0D6T8_9GAMM|nr:type II toxin-antitoxin system HicB family antitoxin [Thorsellia anophelis]SET27329.1 Predicted nuclease of the RNAse H fold, HicB family [Thorsellia anophelis DSM 18579]